MPGGSFQVEILEPGFQKILSLIRPKKAEEMEWLQWVHRGAEIQHSEKTWEILGKPKVQAENFSTMVNPLYETELTFLPNYASRYKMSLASP